MFWNFFSLLYTTFTTSSSDFERFSFQRKYGALPWRLEKDKYLQIKINELRVKFPREQGSVQYRFFFVIIFAVLLKNSGLDETWTLTSVMLVQCSTSWAIRPNGSWSLCGPMISPFFRYCSSSTAKLQRSLTLKLFPSAV